MAITALSNASSSQYVSSSSNLNTIQTSLQSLQRSLGTGNLAAAQTAFNQIQKADQNLASIGGASAPSAQTSTDLAALGTALSKGDLAGAKTAFATVQQDLANVNSLAITAAVASANQAVQQIDALLGQLSSSNDSSTSSSLDSLLGASSATTDIAAQTTSILGNVYGNHTSTAGTTATTGTNVNVSA